MEDFSVSVMSPVSFHTNFPSNNNNNEILIKREPLVYTRARRAVQKKRRRKRLGQYNSNNKLIYGQYTSRYNVHHKQTNTHTHTHSHTHATHTHTHTHTHTYIDAFLSVFSVLCSPLTTVFVFGSCDTVRDARARVCMCICVCARYKSKKPREAFLPKMRQILALQQTLK